jgi:hypothetical protein
MLNPNEFFPGYRGHRYPDRRKTYQPVLVWQNKAQYVMPCGKPRKQAMAALSHARRAKGRWIRLHGAAVAFEERKRKQTLFRLWWRTRQAWRAVRAALARGLRTTRPGSHTPRSPTRPPDVPAPPPLDVTISTPGLIGKVRDGQDS